MINLTSFDVENLEKIGEGRYAISYLKDNKVYKIYKKSIDYGNGWYASNLSLKEKKLRINRLKKLNTKLEHSEILDDVIYVDNKFAGIVHKYIEGKRLDEISRKLLFEEKKIVAYRILESALEETRNGIYKRDIHPGNIIVDNNLNVTIVDLDDLHTDLSYFNNTRRIKRDNYILSDTLKGLFNEYYAFYNELKEVNTNIGLNYQQFFEPRKNKDMTSYEELNDYIEEKSKEVSLLFVYGINDIEILKQANLENKKLILVINNITKDELYKLGTYYEIYGIKFTDAVDENNKIDLIKSYNVTEANDLKNNKLLEENINFTKITSKFFGK